MLVRFLNKTHGDRYIWLIVILLSMGSLLAVYSATGTLAFKKGVGAEHFLLKHLAMIVVGFVLMYYSHKIDYRYYAGVSKVLMIITIPLLLYTLAFGVNLNDASRWVTIPIINQTFQTSDLAKLSLIIFLARMLSRKQETIKDFWKSFLPIMGAVCGIFILIALANLSTALMLFGVSMLLLLIGRISFRQIAATCLLGLVLLMMVIFLGPRRETYRSRIKAFLHPEMQQADKTYQQDHAKIAIATGGIFGKGPGNSLEKNYLPHPYSDFVFAIIVEEYGFVGGVVVIILYLALMFRCMRIVAHAPKAFGTMLAIGLSLSLTIQAFANMAVAVNLFPVTGVPLPLVSMGGTSILFTSVAFGIILSVSKDIEDQKIDTSKPASKDVVMGV